MKKYILIVLILLIFSIIIVPVGSYAMGADLGNLYDYKPNVITVPTNLESKAETILGVIQVIGTVVSVVMLIVIGIKYMLGSIEERAEYKQTLKPYLIGAFLLFSGTTLPQLIFLFVNNL